MNKFRKKPVVIEAVQFQKDNWKDVFEFLHYPNGNMCKYNLTPEGELKIKTLEGDMLAKVSDWIIKGVKGEFYPVKNDIFEQTYERVNGN